MGSWTWRKVCCLSLIPMALIAGCGSTGSSPRADPAAPSSTLPPLPTGRTIDPARAESSAEVGLMPVNMVLSPDGKYAITTGAGYGVDKLCSVRVGDGKLVSFLDFAKGRGAAKTNGLYYGLAFGPRAQLYAAMGAAGKIAVIHLDSDGILKLDHEFATGPHDFPAGLAVDGRGLLYVTHNDPDNAKLPFGTPGSVSVHDPNTGKQVGRFVFQDDAGLSNFPLAVRVTHDGSRVYVSSERDSCVYVLDASDPTQIHLRTAIVTGANPDALLLDEPHGRLYVANANSDTISIIDTASEKVASTVLLRPQVARDLAGATPTGLSLSADGKWLYATLGDMNAVAVIDLTEDDGPVLEGYIPAGWYPTSIAVAGNYLLIANGKGSRVRNPHDFVSGTRRATSPLLLFNGTLWRIPIPTEAQLPAMTGQCLQWSRLTPAYLTGHNPLQSIALPSAHITHVVYIVKENRTYDQILGDDPRGNGDLSRCLFGKDVTPNLHALARRFILLDNFYDSGDVSGDGWTWSTEAQANNYTVRNVPYEYSTRGRHYDYEGTNNEYPTGGFAATGPDGQPLSDDPRFAHGGRPIPDVAGSPGGHLWDMARKRGLTIRNWGYFLTSGVSDEEDKPIIPENYPAVAGLQPAGEDLSGISDIDFRRFDLNFPDSDGPSHWAEQMHDPKFLWPTHSYGKNKLPDRFDEWKREFDMMLAKDPTGASVPNLMLVRFGTDHTIGARGSRPTPRCMVADNDYACGELVDAISHSPIWKSCAIVIVEDDAQNGPDHVDAHRSVCYLASPWIEQGVIDHSFQNTVSTIRTIESLLGLPPMCQYDAASGVIGGWDDAPHNDQPFAAIRPSAAIMAERNPSDGGGRGSEDSAGPEQPHHHNTKATPATQSSTNTPMHSQADLTAASRDMDFSRADQVPADLLNRVIWKTVRGPNSEMPPTPHTLGSAGPRSDDDD
jgi:YVTN family beta-propeller protein